jgi:hypothetical protein
MSNKVQEFAAKNGITNVFHYAAAEERCVFERQAAECGYERKTTFFSDLSIAEWYGADSVRDTYKNVMGSWVKNVVYFTEFVMCLNWLGWLWYERNFEELSKVYFELYEKALNLAYEHYSGDDLSYFIKTLD